MFDYEALRFDLLEWITPDDPPDETLARAGAVESGDYEIYKHKIDSALDEAHSVFMRTGVSSMLKSGDVVVGLHNKRGDLVSASCGTYLHGPIAQLPVKFVIKRYLERDTNVDVAPGDIFYTNEVLTGGLHNPDQMAIMPIFHADELIAWATAALHQGETGAIEPGGMPQSARTRYEEGMRLTPIKIAEDFEIRDDMMDMMSNFILRAPRMQEIDVRARCTAVDVIRKRVREMADEQGGAFLDGLFQRIIQEAETGARNVIATMNDGTFRSVGFYDNIGAEEALMKVSLTLEKQGDEIVLDFSNSSPEAGSLNSFGHGVAAYISSFLYPYVFHELPVSTGAFAPFTFRIPDRSALNADPEASVSQCVILGTVVLSRCHDAFSRLLYATHPERVAAAPDTHEGGGGFTGVNKYGVPEADMVTFNMNTMGGGARADQDGVDAHGFSFGPWGKATNMEEEEESGIFRCVARGFLPDTGGPGKYRGGCGTENINVVVSEEPVSTFRNGKGSRIPSNTGLFGGYAEGSLAGIRVTGPDVEERLAAGEDVPTSVHALIGARAIDGEFHFEPIGRDSRELQPDDLFIRVISGGGGLGDPLERDPAAVAVDVREGKVTPWAAAHVYGVVIDDGEIDRAATEERRDALRVERLDEGVSYADFERDWEARKPPEHALGYYGTWPTGLEVDDTPVRSGD